MLKIRYNLNTRLLSGWIDIEAKFDDLQSRDGEDTAILDMAMPDADDYEYYLYVDNNLIPSGKVATTRFVFTASPPGEALGERLMNIEGFLKGVYPE